MRLQHIVRAGTIVVSVGLAGASVFSKGRIQERNESSRDGHEDGRAKNVILFIGDGMGDSEITIARNYEVGANGRLTMDGFELSGAYTTYALQESDPALIDYVTDSAASGTGWATGVKTSNGRISSIAGTGSAVTSLPTILDRAAGRPPHRQRHDRGAHGCHAGRSQRAHQRARLSGSGQHGPLRSL